MKKLSHLSVGIVLGLFILFSCSNPLVKDEPVQLASTTEGASLRLVFSLLSSRTIAPSEADLAITGYSIRMSRRGYTDLVAFADIAETSGDEGFLMENVVAGTWNITVYALNEVGLTLASGSALVLAEGGMTKYAPIALNYDQSSGTGGVEIAFTFPTGMFTDENKGTFLNSVEASLTFSDGSTTALATAILPSGVPGIEKVVISGSEIKAGSPRLLVSFKGDYNAEVLARVTEIVWVFRNVVTKISKPLLVSRNPTFVEFRVYEDGPTCVFWSEVPYATSYTIYARKDLEGSDYFQLTVLSDAEQLESCFEYNSLAGYEYNISYELLNILVPDTDWLITVSASYGEDESDYTQGMEVPYARAAEAWSSDVGGYYLNWDAVPGATGYNVYLKNQSSSDYVLVSALPPEEETLYQFWDVERRYYTYHFYNDLYALSWVDDCWYDLLISANVDGEESEKLKVAEAYYDASEGYFGEESGFFGASTDF